EELWANLLAAAGEQFDARMIVYVEVLSKITSTEARKIRSLVDLGDNWAYPFEMTVSGHNYECVGGFAEKYLFPTPSDPVDSKYTRVAFDEFSSKIAIYGGELLWVSVPVFRVVEGRVQNAGRHFHYPQLDDPVRGLYRSLEAKGLVTIRHERFTNR